MPPRETRLGLVARLPAGRHPGDMPATVPPVPRRPVRPAVTTNPPGIVIRVTRPTPPVIAALSRDLDTLRERERSARRNADAPILTTDPRAAAALRGKALGYKEAADLIAATLARFTEEVTRG